MSVVRPELTVVSVRMPTRDARRGREPWWRSRAAAGRRGAELLAERVSGDGLDHPAPSAARLRAVVRPSVDQGTAGAGVGETASEGDVGSAPPWSSRNGG